jgi:hypothetical protein
MNEIKPETFKCYLAIFSPNVKHDLTKGSPPIGYQGYWECMWEIDDGIYKGDKAMMPDRYYKWAPSSDLRILREVEYEKYFEIRRQLYEGPKNDK